MTLAVADLTAITLTLQLATVTTLLLMLIATPLAWWLTHTHARWRAAATALVSLPLVLPPTVLGFYLLVLLGPQGMVGQWMQQLGLATLPFTSAMRYFRSELDDHLLRSTCPAGVCTPIAVGAGATAAGSR